MTFRILICVFIGLLGILTTFLQLDMIYRIVFMNLHFFNPLLLSEIFFCILLFLITLSAIPALIFHIQIIKFGNFVIDTENSDPKTNKMTSLKFTRLIWCGNVFFGLLAAVLAALILKVTISNHFRHENVFYHNYFVSAIILF